MNPSMCKEYLGVNAMQKHATALFILSLFGKYWKRHLCIQKIFDNFLNRLPQYSLLCKALLRRVAGILAIFIKLLKETYRHTFGLKSTCGVCILYNNIVLASNREVQFYVDRELFHSELYWDSREEFYRTSI